MLAYHLNNETGVLEVTETTMSFTDTVKRYWYYDTRKWLKSSHGKKGDTPDRVMTEVEIKWVRDYYLPKVSVLKAA